MSNDYSFYGLVVNSPQDLQKLVEDRFTLIFSTDKYLKAVVDNNLALVFPKGEKGEIYSNECEFHFETNHACNVFYNQKEQSVNSLCGFHTFNNSYPDFPFEVLVVNDTPLTDMSVDTPVRLQLSAYPKGMIEGYDTVTSFHQVHPQVNEESFLPISSWEKEEGKKVEHGLNLFAGTVLNYELRGSRSNKLFYYHFLVTCLGLLIEVNLRQEDLNIDPYDAHILYGAFNFTAMVEERYHFVGQELHDLKAKNPLYEKIYTLGEIYQLVRVSYSKQTAYPSTQMQWTSIDPEYGQCAIVAKLVYSLFGGQIMRIVLPDGGTHYFNQINDTVVDLTSAQFDIVEQKAPYESGKEIDPNYLSTSMDTKKRYKLLLDNLKIFSQYAKHYSDN